MKYGRKHALFDERKKETMHGNKNRISNQCGKHEEIEDVHGIK